MKLTTKLGLIFLLVIVLVGGGLGFFGIPSMKQYLFEQEINYSRSFLEREAKYTSLRILNYMRENETKGIEDPQTKEAIRELFARTSETFADYFSHETARMFVIDETGEIWQSSDPTRNGKSVSNVWIYDNGKRDKLLRDIKEREKTNEMVHQFSVDEVDGGKRIPKILFVAQLPVQKFNRKFYMCISENETDLAFTANWMSKSLILVLAITILFFYIFFQVFYSRLRKRYDRVVEHAKMIAAGNYNVKIGDRENDEIGILAQTIDRLAAQMSSDKAFEDHYVQGQKMEMIGTLASGIAHDFNNMLGGILSGLDLASQELKSPTNKETPDLALLSNTIRVTRDCANRGKETVEKLLSFSRKREANMLPLDLNKVLRSVQEICQHSFDKRIRIETQLWEKGPATILADRSLLEQAIMNVCINARDAMKKNTGTLSLGIEQVEKSRPSPEKTAVELPYWCLSIKDNGSGIPPRVLSRIFEPFYTTKEKGTGLGLAMLYKTVSDLGGWVDIDSKVGKGTAFYLYIPVSTELADADSSETPAEQTEAKQEAQKDDTSGPDEEISKGKEVILVIDDDEFMLQMTEDILTRLGYTPIAAPDGEKGLEAFKKHKDNIEIVLLDLMLPDLGGDEIFDTIKEMRPDMKVLLISGFKRDPRIADLLVRGCDGFLNKPYSIEDLSKALRDILDS